MNKSYNLFAEWNTKQLQISEAKLQTIYYTHSSDLAEERMRERSCEQKWRAKCEVRNGTRAEI